MFIMWLLPVWGPETSAGRSIWQSFDRRQKNKLFIGSRKQQHITKGFRESENKFAMLKKLVRSKLRAL